MNDFKIIFVKLDDEKKIVENLKSIMEEYDMQLIRVEGNKYTFDRDGGYSREFAIYKAPNGWTVIRDEDDVQAESMCQELSELSSCFVLCIGIYNEDLLFYTAFNEGVQVDQYMSTMEYYEYQLDENAINSHKGNAEVFRDVIKPENTIKLQEVLNNCREGEIEPGEAYIEIQKILGLVEVQKKDTENMEDMDDAEQNEEEIIEFGEIFFVDFNSINIKIDSQEKVIDAVRKITQEKGYVEVDSFETASEEKKGFFKKIISSVTEKRRITFYISPPSFGWITLVGEVEVLFGEEPAQWEFLHIEDRLSQILERDVINIYGDSEHWGFRIFKEGELVCQYSSDNNGDSLDGTWVFDETDRKLIDDILQSDANSPEEIDNIMQEFCSALKIRNYKINIPMDYTDEEYKARILNKLPDGDGFVELRYIKKR